VKILFAFIVVALGLASVGTYLRMPDVTSDRPIIYWVTDPNPARHEQVNRFHQWLIKNGHYTEEVIESPRQAERVRALGWSADFRSALRAMNPRAEALFAGTLNQEDYPLTLRVPKLELRLDTVNADPSKVIIQGISGVAAQVVQTGPTDLPYFHAVGLFEDVTDEALELGFDPSRTWDAIRPQLVLDERQYRFPANVFAHMYWVNKETFRKYGMDPPPRQWDFDTFERIGKEFVARANASGGPRVFFSNTLDIWSARRSLGLDTFNETLTACTLDDPRYVQVLERIFKWTYEDRLLPSAADVASFAAEAGYGGSAPQLFYRGQYGMMRSGRYMLIQFRQFGAMELSVSEPPHGGFRNTDTGTRTASVYSGAEPSDKRLAVLFLAYLASEDYNTLIVHDADALPPNPIYTRTEEFLRPAAYPNEWGTHEVFSETAEQIAIVQASSPFVLPGTAGRIDHEAYQAVMARRISASEAAAQAGSRINAEIERTLRENPHLQERYAALVEDQRTIERLRAAGEKVPLELIRNPFHQRYYQAMGWAE
jgi:multiple sugar transport system substrate-binding protein